ncbi:MAG TPA: hypothetical protein ENI92_07735, partial [Bacteroidetes bacterium]|nr:hypothetical protein [Bacteroidota bacterium]
MARPVRIFIPNTTYLVQIRARDERPLFTGEKDRELFLAGLGDAAPAAGVKVYGYALLDRSALFFLRTGSLPLSKFVHRTQAGFINRFRSAFPREEPPRIRDRHRAILVEEETHFLPVLRRVHLAPAMGEPWSKRSEGRKLGEISTHRWTSYSIYIGSRENPPWFDRREGLRYFRKEGGRKEEEQFFRFLVEGLKRDEEDVLD